MVLEKRLQPYVPSQWKDGPPKRLDLEPKKRPDLRPPLDQHGTRPQPSSGPTSSRTSALLWTHMELDSLSLDPLEFSVFVPRLGSTLTQQSL
uniref:Uncharacterized protein n=1 Tax=Knipowitschia caucasica TaxID=637954 RepID=A0AAV2ME66_KNICA